MVLDLPPGLLLLLGEHGLTIILLARGEPLLAHEENVDEALQVDEEGADSLGDERALVLVQERDQAHIDEVEDIADEYKSNYLVAHQERLVLANDCEADDRRDQHDQRQDHAVPLIVPVGLQCVIGPLLLLLRQDSTETVNSLVVQPGAT